MLTAEELRTTLRAMLPSDIVISNDKLDEYLKVAEGIVLNRRYPFGYEEGTQVEFRYQHIQAQIALELIGREGAPGEIQHNEGGINREYSGGDISPALLRKITPKAGGLK